MHTQKEKIYNYNSLLLNIMKDIQIKGFVKVLNYFSWFIFFQPLGLVIWIIILLFQNKKPLKEGYLTRTSEKFRVIFMTCYFGLIILGLIVMIIFNIF